MDDIIKRNVIIVTDGDLCAKKAIEIATKNIQGRCISRSSGNPTELTGLQIVEFIKKADHDPVVVMVDDKGDTQKGYGEQAMEYIINCPEINVLGVIAVASNTRDVKGIKIDCSVDKNGYIIKKAVNKNGNEKKDKIIKGDTLDVLNKMKIPIIVGVGDPGKMDGYDNCYIGAPIITKALEKILEYNNYKNKMDG